ncbi:MAG TPA: hypothetical protein PKZ76_03425, partial [Xanthomonadaceae bacterium]|nr:hypothetical protein [Xanthomonadaceae bacterium]
MDTTLFGMCEVALLHAYRAARPNTAAVPAIRARLVAQVYNTAVRRIVPDQDPAPAVRDAAQMLIVSLDDPLDPELLERNLLRQP